MKWMIRKCFSWSRVGREWGIGEFCLNTRWARVSPVVDGELKDSEDVMVCER